MKKDYNELNADLKSAWRENKEQAHELRDLKKQNAQLKEAIRASGDNRSHKDQILTERRRFYEHVDMLDDHINHLKHQLDKTKLHMDQLTFQTREANEEKAAYESKLQALQKQNARLNDDLTECRDDILRLQPPSQIPDSKIAEQCSNLYQQIASWVDDEAEESSSMETQLGNLFADKEAPELLKSCMDGDLIRATRKHSDAEPLILRYIIQCHLHRMILTDDIYLFGLDDHNVTILRSIEHAMEDLEPKRGMSRSYCRYLKSLLFQNLAHSIFLSSDALTIKRWRSETLQALAKIPGFRDEQTSQAVAVSKSLFSALCYLLPEISSKDDSSGWRKLHETCTMPAVQLATTMRFSTAVYRMIPRLPSRASSSPSERHILYHHDIGRYTLVDVASQKVIRQESIIKIGEDGRIGENLMVVQPLLLRMQKETGGVALCKPVVVIKLDEPLARKGRGIKVLGTWTSGWFGGEQSEGREESTRA